MYIYKLFCNLSEHGFKINNKFYNNRELITLYDALYFINLLLINPILRIINFIVIALCLPVTSAIAFEQSVISEHGFYTIEFSNHLDHLPLRQMHTWQVKILDENGNDFIPGNISINGGMPSHGHGLPSEPKFTRYLGNGKLQLEGVLFNMAGAWELRVTLTGPKGLDTAVLAFDIPVGEKATSLTQKDSLLTQLRSLHLNNLPPPTDKSNRFITNKTAQDFGESLFFDRELSASGTVSCASCHQPEKLFTDGRKLSFGSTILKRHAPTLLGIAYSKWFYWDGRRDSLWSQAVTPIESKGEMDNDRTAVAHYLWSRNEYREKILQLEPSIKYAELENITKHASPFGDSSIKSAWNELNPNQQHIINTIFILAGKSLATYISTLQHQESKFDMAIDSLIESDDSKLTAEEYQGMQIFLDTAKSDCLRCHNGPLLTNHGFHNIGTGPNSDGTFDYGRVFGIQAAGYDIFNCLGKYSDDHNACGHIKFAQRTKNSQTINGAFKVPTLRGISKTAPYMHDGRFLTIDEVVEFYRNPPDLTATSHDILPLQLTDEEAHSLIAFLKIL